MGTHPLQGHNRELTLAEGVPEEGSGRPRCQPARTEGLKENARGGRGLRSPKKRSHGAGRAGESRGGRGGPEWASWQETRSKRAQHCPA